MLCMFEIKWFFLGASAKSVYVSKNTWKNIKC